MKGPHGEAPSHSIFFPARVRLHDPSDPKPPADTRALVRSKRDGPAQASPTMANQRGTEASQVQRPTRRNTTLTHDVTRVMHTTSQPRSAGAGAGAGASSMSTPPASQPASQPPRHPWDAASASAPWGPARPRPFPFSQNGLPLPPYQRSAFPQAAGPTAPPHLITTSVAAATRRDPSPCLVGPRARGPHGSVGRLRRIMEAARSWEAAESEISPIATHASSSSI